MKTLLIAIIALSFTYAQANFCVSTAPKAVGKLHSTLSEASGFTQSKMNAGYFIWLNDSGNSNTLYATNKKGQLAKQIPLNGFSNVDFESLEQGPCFNNPAESCLYVADVGDGMGWRSSFKIGVFRENDFWSKKSISPIKAFSYEYPRGAENSEAIVVLNDSTLLLFSKNQTGISNVYQFNLKARSPKPVLIAQLNLNKVMAGARGKGPRVTDASYSPTKGTILLLTYGDIIEMKLSLILNNKSATSWKKGVDYQILKTPRNLEQKETVAYVNDGTSILVTSEKKDSIPPIYEYQCHTSFRRYYYR